MGPLDSGIPKKGLSQLTEENQEQMVFFKLDKETV